MTTQTRLSGVVKTIVRKQKMRSEFPYARGPAVLPVELLSKI
jgi:hypothetical protein